MNSTDRPNILLVDDNPDNLLILEGILDELDLNIYKAGSGNEALSMILETEFALVLLDVQMPEMDGYETAGLMRSNNKTKDIPIIFITAIDKEQSHIFKGYETGAVDYIFKPVDPFILKSKINIFIDLYLQKNALKTANARLERTIEELEAANEKMIAQQESIVEKERLTMLLQMAGTAAHELNQPLTILQGNVDLIKMGTKNPEQLNLYLGRIEEAGDRIAEIVRKIQSLRHDKDKSYHENSIIDLHHE